ncbi:unnamed protein product [Urochloa decumbens]|uniref:KIB1-4 beta-propeller domain-containing protein n=1 Tax=Urochloa decumbens TaxID=240449 RepID=A0ABC9G7D0_9POAL
METVETQELPPAPLDPTLAPILLFNYGRGGADPEEEGDDGARLVYSIPKRRLLLAGEVDLLIDDVNWITPQGWVLTLDSSTRATSLRDPFTSSRAIPLPPDTGGLLAGSDETRCVMSTPTPVDPGCVVLVIHRADPVLCYCRPGGIRWYRHEYAPELLIDGDPNNRGRAYIVEAVYGLTAAGDGRFHAHFPCDSKLATLAFSPTAAGPPALSSSHFCYTRLCDRRMLLVEVKKLELAKSVFVKVTELGDNRAFFVRRGQFGAWMAAYELGLKPNCIYFTNSNDKGLYVYDMEQGTTSLHNPGQDVPDSMQPILLMPVSL